MKGRNINVYFREETYNQIKDLLGKREVSRFINQAVESQLQEKEQQNKKKLQQQLIVVTKEELNQCSKLVKIFFNFNENCL